MTAQQHGAAKIPKLNFIINAREDSGTAEHVEMIRELLASFPAREPPDLARIKGLPCGERGKDWGSA